MSYGKTYNEFKPYLQENNNSKKKEVPNYKLLDAWKTLHIKKNLIGLVNLSKISNYSLFSDNSKLRKTVTTC